MNRLITRRNMLWGLVAAPAIIKIQGLLMPIKPLILEPDLLPLAVEDAPDMGFRFFCTDDKGIKHYYHGQAG